MRHSALSRHNAGIGYRASWQSPELAAFGGRAVMMNALTVGYRLPVSACSAAPPQGYRDTAHGRELTLDRLGTSRRTGSSSSGVGYRLRVCVRVAGEDVADICGGGNVVGHEYYCTPQWRP